MQWMAQLISESDTPGSSQPPATDKGKRPLPGRGVQTRGGHSKRTKVSRDSAADLSSLPFSQSHHTGSLRTQTSSLISPTPITAPAGRTIVSSAPQTTPQMTSPIGTVGPAPSTIVHQTGLTAATTISMEPSTSTPTPRTSAPQGITHFMSRADKLLQMERSATPTVADAINTIHGAQKMHAVTYESMHEELLDTHQRVYDRDVEKAALFDRNRILNRQVQDLKEVISSLNLQLREAQEQLQQKSVVTTMVCERCAQMELTVTTTTPVAPISLPTEEIPTTYSSGVSLASHTLTGSHEQTEVVTSMPLPPHGVLPCPLPGRPYVGASTYAPSMPATPFVSSAPIQPHPNIYSSHFGTLLQYNMQLPTPHQLPSPSQALVSSSISIQPNPALYSSHFGTLPGYHMAIPPPSHLPSPSQVQPAYSLYPNLGFNPYNPLRYNYPPALIHPFMCLLQHNHLPSFTHRPCLHHPLRNLNSLVNNQHPVHTINLVLSSVHPLSGTLADFCCRKLLYLNTRARNDANYIERNASDLINMSVEDEFKEKVEGDLCLDVKCSQPPSSDFKFLTDYINSLPLCIMARLIDKHDVLLSLVPLIGNSPWKRKRRKGEQILIEKYEEGRWLEVPTEDHFKVVVTASCDGTS
ncbi:hypothetical protein L7F22_051422 [Adiantum nelumboides]|nr:hypothetical protein [Adiantum nelumboides]